MRPFPRFVIVGASICLIGAIFLPRAATRMALAQTAPAPQERVIPQSRADALLSFAPVVKKAQPAVVNVFASRVDRMPANSYGVGSGYTLSSGGAWQWQRPGSRWQLSAKRSGNWIIRIFILTLKAARCANRFPGLPASQKIIFWQAPARTS